MIPTRHTMIFTKNKPLRCYKYMKGWPVPFWSAPMTSIPCRLQEKEILWWRIYWWKEIWCFPSTPVSFLTLVYRPLRDLVEELDSPIVPKIQILIIYWASLYILILFNIFKRDVKNVTFHIVSSDPSAAGTNHTEFMMVISDGLWTNCGVKNRPNIHPVEPDKPKSAVANVLCSSANQCWLILVGTHAIKGHATPVNACPINANWYRVSASIS